MAVALCDSLSFQTCLVQSFKECDRTAKMQLKICKLIVSSMFST